MITAMTAGSPYRYSSVDVAFYIVAEANVRHVPVNMTKVQKLLYVAYGLYLAVKGGRLTDEHPQAWPYGPVFPTTRNRLLKEDMYSISMEDAPMSVMSGDAEFVSLIDLVFRSFGKWTASQLSEWSHGDGTPWQRTVSEESFRWGRQIPDEYIVPYFKSLIA